MGFRFVKNSLAIPERNRTQPITRGAMVDADCHDVSEELNPTRINTMLATRRESPRKSNVLR